MKNRLFKAIAVLSLLVEMATLAMWRWSYWVPAGVQWGTDSFSNGSVFIREHRVLSKQGTVEYMFTRTSGHMTGKGSDMRWFRSELFPPDDFFDPNPHSPSWLEWLGLKWQRRASFMVVGGGQSSTIAIDLHYWFLTILFWLTPTWWLKKAWQRRSRPPGLCAHCGYDLRATPGRCPECGTAIQPLVN